MIDYKIQRRDRFGSSCWFLPLLLFVQILSSPLLLTTSATPTGNEKSSTPAKGGVSFLILHNNDMHARFEQTSRTGGKCTQDAAAKNQCYGGFARVAYEVRSYRQNKSMPVIYLNAGDTYTGTPWFTVFKDKIAADFLNKLSPDAVSLGNHEFDENVDGLLPFLERAKFPVLAANLDLSREPRLRNAANLKNSTILNVNGHQVGVIGYLTPDTKKLTQPNNVSYIDEVVAINAEAARLKAKGIKIFIAVGHSGYQMDKRIAAECPDIDVVIGGHTNTFLYNGTQPDLERIEGPYPTMVRQESGKMVPVVQAYAYTKYLGRLQVKFDGKGNLLEYDNTPLLLNADIERAKDVLDLLNEYRPNITALERDVIGYTKVQLVGSAAVCRTEECNLGNLIADSMIDARVSERPVSKYWTDAPIALMMSGGIRSSIDLKDNGSIVGTDILTVLPFANALYKTKIFGRTLRKALEHSASMHEKDSNGGFLQMSGVHVTYDYCKPLNQRVVDVTVRCKRCTTPHYEPLDDNKMYSVIVPLFLLLGGDGHVFHEKDFDISRTVILKLNDAEALKAYIHKLGTVYPDTEQRITIRDECHANHSSSSTNPALKA